MSGGFNLVRWQPHLEAARREGKTLRQYASEHGISRHTLYGAQQVLRRMQAQGGLPPMAQGKASAKPASKPSFSAVRIMASAARGVAKVELGAPAPVRIRAQLPNGVMLEWPCGAAETAFTVKLIGTLAGLPCSG